ncbi:MAG: hypothetical protein IH612_16610, partial [Desulfofustis sp.]|nr:hypothetical protein [Desulfofustis sp.]
MRKLPAIILFVASIVIARQPVTVYGYSCEPAQLTSHSFTGQDSSYVISRRCTHTYSHGGNEVLNLTYFGTWKGATEVATEHVSNRVRYYKDGVQKNDQTYQYDVTAKCLQDPWLTGMDCYSHHVDYPYPECGGVATTPPNPKGASILPAALRQSLQQEYYELRAAPTILEPVNNTTFGFPVAIPIRIQHNPDYNLRFKIEWRPDAQHALKQVSTNIITGEQTVNGIMTATVHPTEEGEWTIRAQLDTNASPWWSDPVTVTVKGSSSEAVVPVELETISLPVSGPLTAPEVLLPRVNHTYAAGETIPLQIGFQKGTRLHYQLGVRAKGSSAFNMFPAVQSADNGSGFFDAKIPGYIGALVDGDVAELLVKAWVERPETSNPQQYLSN